MDNRETLTPSSGDAIIKRHLFSEVVQKNWMKVEVTREGVFRALTKAIEFRIQRGRFERPNS